MARATKRARNLVFAGVKYRWRATGNDDGIALTLWPATLPGPEIRCHFDYGHTLTPADGGVTHLSEQLVVTARIVRRVVDYATFAKGYDPAVKGTPLELRDIERHIDVSDAIRSD